jgi:peptidoglycan/LPS O-acetylase OafA/YrhL
MDGPTTLVLLIGGGLALLLGHRPWARTLAGRRGLSPWQARVLRANLAYNGAAAMLAGLLLAAGAPPARPGPTLAGWALLASIALLGLALAPLTLGWWEPRGRRGA